MVYFAQLSLGEVSRSMIVFQDYFKANQIAENGDYAKVFYGKCCVSQTKMSNKDRKNTLCSQLHQVSMKLESKRSNFTSLFETL